MNMRKNVYEISFNFVDDTLVGYFTQDAYTPLPIASVNGIEKKNTSRRIHTVMFPNPLANKMIFEICNRLQPRTKFSSIIVEYCDAHNKPVVYLFSDGSIHNMVENPNAKMNNNMRRDLQYQIQLRKNMIANAKQKRR